MNWKTKLCSWKVKKKAPLGIWQRLRHQRQRQRQQRRQVATISRRIIVKVFSNVILVFVGYYSVFKHPSLYFFCFFIIIEFDFLNCDTQKLCNFSLAFLTFVLFSAIVFLVSSIVSINLKCFYMLFLYVYVSLFLDFRSFSV